jgi:hypothetical protein
MGNRNVPKRLAFSKAALSNAVTGTGAFFRRLFPISMNEIRAGSAAPQ